MGTCNIDHSQEDVVKKLESQQTFLPEELAGRVSHFLLHTHSQAVLNDLFHLLKKYDLASAEEKEERNQKIRQLTA